MNPLVWVTVGASLYVVLSLLVIACGRAVAGDEQLENEREN